MSWGEGAVRPEAGRPSQEPADRAQIPWEDPGWVQLSSVTLSPVAMVDVIFADVAQPDQTRIVALNAHTFLRNGGHFVISIKVRGSGS